MHEDLIKRLRRCEQFRCRECEYEQVMGCRAKLNEEAADAIEEAEMNFRHLEREYKELCSYLPKWIPVTERLPKAERKSYWVCTDTGYQCECRWTNDRFGIIESDEWGWKIFDIPQYQKVVAWMQLPCPYEPPKEEAQ